MRQLYNIIHLQTEKYLIFFIQTIDFFSFYTIYYREGSNWSSYQLVSAPQKTKLKKTIKLI